MLEVPFEEEISVILVTKEGLKKELKTEKVRESAFKKSSGIIIYKRGGYIYEPQTLFMFETKEIAYKTITEEIEKGEEYIVYIPSESKIFEKEASLKEVKEELSKIQEREIVLKEYISQLEKELQL